MTEYDKKAIAESINRKRPFSLNFKYAERSLLMMINGIYSKMLTAHDQLYILNSVISIMREVVTNAQKANAKRLFFSISGMDINDPDQYARGMKDFKTSFMQKQDELSKVLTNNDFSIGINFSVSDDEISISVVNNAAVLPGEMERIRERMKKARSYASLMDAYEDVGDSTEGAGLGIALVVVTLKNIGIDPSLFTIESGNELTTVALRIPRQLKPHDIVSKVKERILGEIHDLPPFPASTVKIMELCDDPESSFEAIAGGIMSDPALASGVMKLSNSAAFITAKKIENMSDAVRILGLRNIRSMIMASSARRIIEDRYAHFEEIWEHSTLVASYARRIGNRFHGTAIAEKAALAGLLHDLGKIILLATDPKTAQKIAEQFKDRMLITETFMEEISIGISHSTMGGLIAEGWNFPDYLVESIRHHHSPLESSGVHEDIVTTVYLANMLSGIEARKYEFDYIYESILDKYGLSDENAFNVFHAGVKKETGK